MKKRILSLALVLALCLGLAAPALAAGTTETVEDEEQGVVITMYGFLRKDTNRYMVNGEETELTFYVVEDNSAVTVSAMAGRNYASPYLRSDGLTDIEAFWGYWDAGSPHVKDYAYKLSGEYSWDLRKKEFHTYSGMATPLYMQPETTVVMSQSSSYYMDVNWDYSVLWICESDFALLEPIGGKADVPETPVKPAVNTASPTNDKLTVDGAAAAPTAYKISGSNYFKLRDVAALLNGSAKEFDVGYDSATKSVTITTGKGYAAQSGDLQPAPAGKQEATTSNNAVYIDGVKVELTVYKINGNNYFMLRDLGQKLGFNVGWESGRGMFIETDKSYDPSN